MHATVCLLRAGQPRRASRAAKSGQFIGQFTWVTGDPMGVKGLSTSNQVFLELPLAPSSLHLHIQAFPHPIPFFFPALYMTKPPQPASLQNITNCFYVHPIPQLSINDVIIKLIWKVKLIENKRLISDSCLEYILLSSSFRFSAFLSCSITLGEFKINKYGLKNVYVM